MRQTFEEANTRGELATRHSQPYIAILWGRSDAGSPFPYSALQSPAFKVLAVPLVTLFSLLVSQTQTLTLSSVKPWYQLVRDFPDSIVTFVLRRCKVCVCTLAKHYPS